MEGLPSSEVPLADAAIATEIANAAARGRGADRAPTLEQLLAAFGETSPTPAARARVAAALRVAGMGVRPDLASAEPGQRLMLLPPGVSEGRSRGRALLGIVGVAAVLVAAAAGASLLQGDGDDGDGNVASNLPAETTTSGPATTTTAVETTATETTATETAPVETTATETTPADTETTATETTSADEDEEAAAKQAAAERKRKAAAKRKRAAAAKRKAAASALVTVRVNAPLPTFLCVDDGSGKVLFSGTLDGKKVFKDKRVRMNIGLKSTQITVNGNPIRLDGSPAGLDITRKGGAKSLASGNRPCG
ncbi:hypothetical protein [Baekduia sp. Peel2402]|uniref:hypothetical protein n=1 Tax=Baekduia sp. Peel2402 TaxID=3458296 RepID=UPI00403E7627